LTQRTGTLNWNAEEMPGQSRDNLGSVPAKIGRISVNSFTLPYPMGLWTFLTHHRLGDY